MAYDKVIDSARLDADLKGVADVIREKTGSSETIAFPDGFKAAIAGIQSGGGDSSALDALIDGSAVSITSTATKIRSYAFKESKIVSGDFPNVEEVLNFAFDNCYSLASINLPNVTKIGSSSFSSCSALETLNLPNVTTIASSSFSRCGCTSVNIPKITTINSSAFQYCAELVNANFPSAKSISSSAFGYCSALKFLDFPLVATIASSAFSNCTSFETLILRKEQVATIASTSVFGSTPFASSGTGGIVYVPREFIEEYQAATNWSTLYAAGTCTFLALEDYTVDGTITGEMDWDKINGGATV